MIFSSNVALAIDIIRASAPPDLKGTGKKERDSPISIPIFLRFRLNLDGAILSVTGGSD